jgi:hypothetical protein
VGRIGICFGPNRLDRGDSRKGFATGILVTAVIFYFIMVLAIVKQSATSPTESVQLEMTRVRQEIRALGDKLESVRRTLEE